MKLKLIFNDALIELPKLKTESIDFVVTDPPYNVSVKNKITRKNTKDIEMYYGEWDDMTVEEFTKFTEKWVKECVRILKKEGWIYVFFGDRHWRILENAMYKYGILKRGTFTWCKSNPPPSYRKYNQRSSTESVFIGEKPKEPRAEKIFIGSKGECRIPNFLEQYEMKNYKKTPARCVYGKYDHPNEKPIVLLDLFIRIGSNEGDTVLDPFMGSGTTGEACIKHNRSFIGIDNSPIWFPVSKDRLENYKKYVETIQGDSLLV